jgi:formylglycine-generating enzyme required for sulfatase activity
LTEAEWEYAARAGQPERFSFGNDEAKLDEYGWYRDNSGGSPQAVGQKKPNAFGLYDTHGNVFEWVEDCYKDDYNAAPTA